MTAPSSPHDLASVIRDGGVHAVYQPIVDIFTGEIVAFEALARGPEGTDLARPDQLFAAAEAAGLVAELDWECRAAAVRGALQAGLSKDIALFVNVEPRVLGARLPDRHRALLDEAAARLRVFVEITERPSCRIRRRRGDGAGRGHRGSCAPAVGGHPRRHARTGRFFGRPGPLPTSVPVPESEAELPAAAATRRTRPRRHTVRAARPPPWSWPRRQPPDFGAGLVDEPAPNVRGVGLSEEHPLVDEWIVCLVSPHFAAALVAHEAQVDDCVDCPDDGGEHFEYHLVYEREVALDVARRLLLEVAPRVE